MINYQLTWIHNFEKSVRKYETVECSSVVEHYASNMKTLLLLLDA